MRLLRGLGRRIGLALFVGGLVLSPHAASTLRLLVHAGEGAIAQYRLQQLPPEAYAAEIETALAAGDGEMARAVLALAARQNVAVPTHLSERVAALPALDIGAVMAEGWNCVVNGDFDSPGGFACVVATDLSSIGDVRDLVAQGGNYLSGQPVNYLTLGLSGVGLSLTAATIGTGGAALPLRAGASFLKAVSKAGKVPPRLAAQLARTLSRSIDRGALEEALRLVREARIGDLGAPLARLFNPRAVALLGDMAGDFGRIGKAGGVRAMKASVEVADSARDVKVLARTADRYGEGFPAVVKMLGKGAVRIADLVWRIGGWVLAVLAWLFAMVTFVLRLASGAARVSGRLLFRRRGRAG